MSQKQPMQYYFLLLSPRDAESEKAMAPHSSRSGKSLENPMGGGAWWAAVHGVTKSRT